MLVVAVSMSDFTCSVIIQTISLAFEPRGQSKERYHVCAHDAHEYCI